MFNKDGVNEERIREIGCYIEWAFSTLRTHHNGRAQIPEADLEEAQAILKDAAGLIDLYCWIVALGHPPKRWAEVWKNTN